MTNKKDEKMTHKSSIITMFVLIGMLFLSVVSVYAETAEEYFNRGNTSYKQGNFAQAISDYTKAIEINSNYAEAYNHRGLPTFSKITQPKPSQIIRRPLK